MSWYFFSKSFGPTVRKNTYNTFFYVRLEKLEVQSKLAIRNFLVALKLFLNSKSSVSLWSKWQIGHMKWSVICTNLLLIKPFLIAKFDCTSELFSNWFLSFISGQSIPFQVRFVSDLGEQALETKQNGFQLGYIQT